MSEKKRKGPRPMPRHMLKTSTVHASITPPDKRRVVDASALVKMRESDFIRAAVMDKVSEIEKRAAEAKNDSA